VALGEASHDTAEITRLKHRTLHHLIEQKGFRAIAWEDDWSLGTLLNQYILTGRGDLRALMGQMSDAWRSEEVKAVFEYLRSYNASHRDKVQFAGVEYFSTRLLAYDAVDAYVAKHAPHRLAELRAVLDPIRRAAPRAPDRVVLRGVQPGRQLRLPRRPRRREP
jgi:erythromycin esterase